MDIIDVEVDGRPRWPNVVAVATVCTRNRNVDLTLHSLVIKLGLLQSLTLVLCV